MHTAPLLVAVTQTLPCVSAKSQILWLLTLQRCYSHTGLYLNSELRLTTQTYLHHSPLLFRLLQWDRVVHSNTNAWPRCYCKNGREALGKSYNRGRTQVTEGVSLKWRRGSSPECLQIRDLERGGEFAEKINLGEMKKRNTQRKAVGNHLLRA